jgi:hypothetical protein
MAISYNYSTKEITVNATATVRAVYSDAMAVFDDAAQMNDLIPLRADTPTLYTLINGWTFTTDSIQYLTSAALQDSSGDNVWTNVQTLGSIVSGTTLYIEQNGAVFWTAGTTGHINMLLKTRSGGSDIDGQNFKVYARKFQQEYSSFATTGGAIVSNCPLATKPDSQLDIAQATIDAYTGLTITWGATTKDAGDGQGAQPYSVVVDCGGYTLKEAYNWVQSELLKSTDIDDGAGTKIGKLTAPLISFTGTGITAQGVWFEDFAAADANKIKYTDDNAVLHTPPSSIAISIASSTGMSGGRVAVYRLGATYNPATYVPGDIVATLLDTTLDGSGNASTSLTYVADWPVVVRTRKAGYKPFEVGTTLTAAGLSVTSINEQDTIYQA